MNPVPALLVLLMAFAGAEAGEVAIAIANPLDLEWPWELVHRDLPAATLAPPLVMEAAGERRPAQLEQLADGRQRIWFLATLHRQGQGRGAPLAVTVRSGEAASALALSEEGD